jgi:hypothetical protein
MENTEVLTSHKLQKTSWNMTFDVVLIELLSSFVNSYFEPFLDGSIDLELELQINSTVSPETTFLSKHLT